MQVRLGIAKLQLDPPPPILTHGLIGNDVAGEVFGIERLRAILMEHRKIGKLYMQIFTSIDGDKYCTV